ncbi:MCL1, BCL2 family apoptosis regulator L homeolog [Xenopus laevis]|uniref:MCL1, BCL2 family apoptosis regulator L homeolog n=1 Tax=Xenopus laevis TaxID=8355 RepID=B6V6J0_XENLA|nr:MCL1, BCL2 family apoptosis regulator L homeolog [Xenopus laevis]ACI47310.1 myeloid cell leukemia 1 [Xenopus laevis]
MMHQSVIAKQRPSTSFLIPCQFYCSGGGSSEKTLSARGASPWDPDMDTHRPQLNGLGFNNGGSLPCSQEDELDEDMDNGSQGSTSPPDSPVCPKDGLYMDTQQLILAFYRVYSGEESGELEASCLLQHGVHHKALETLLRVGGEIIEKHHMAFTGMLQRLSIHSREDLQKLSEVPALVFNDGVTNWGRIVTVISFGAFVAKHLKSLNLEDCIGVLAEHFTQFLMMSKKDWIIQEKGWDGFVDFFHIEDYESGLKTVLMAFSSVAVLGAGLAYMIR